MGTNFHLAPPSVTVDGLVAVPIDIQSIDAVYVFDGAASTATADATMNYTLGPTAGNPIFDLRQAITAAWLDGVSFPVAQLAHHNVGTGSFTNLRVIESVQSAGSVHTLRVQYTLAIPDSQLGGSYRTLVRPVCLRSAYRGRGRLGCGRRGLPAFRCASVTWAV